MDGIKIKQLCWNKNQARYWNKNHDNAKINIMTHGQNISYNTIRDEDVDLNN